MSPVRLSPVRLSQVRRSAAIAVAAVSLVAGAALARAPADKEKAELQAAVATFSTAMTQRDYERLVDTVPPRILDALATKSGLDRDKIRSSMVDLFRMLESEAKVEEFTFDVKAIEYKELKNGTPYALVPTRTVINFASKGRMAQKSNTLALLDDGVWRLVRIDEISQLMLLREVFPEFTSVEFPQGSMEALDK